jgi:hypothetical protein
LLLWTNSKLKIYFIDFLSRAIFVIVRPFELSGAQLKNILDSLTGQMSPKLGQQLQENIGYVA